MPEGRELMPTNLPPVAHYAHGRIQPIEFIEANFTPDEYRGALKHCVLKYICRYRLKGGVDDLRKAQTYLGWLVEFELKESK